MLPFKVYSLVIFQYIKMLCSHCRCQVPTHCHHPQNETRSCEWSLSAPQPTTTRPSTKTSLISFLSLWTCLFQTFLASGVIQYVPNHILIF